MPRGTPSSSLGRAGYDGVAYDGAAWDAIAAIAPCSEPATGAHSASAAGAGGGACPVVQDGPGGVASCARQLRAPRRDSRLRPTTHA